PGPGVYWIPHTGWPKLLVPICTTVAEAPDGRPLMTGCDQPMKFGSWETSLLSIGMMTEVGVWPLVYPATVAESGFARGASVLIWNCTVALEEPLLLVRVYWNCGFAPV